MADKEVSFVFGSGVDDLVIDLSSISLSLPSILVFSSDISDIVWFLCCFKFSDKSSVGEESSPIVSTFPISS